MRALLLVVPVSLVAALVTGCFNLKNDDSAFCPTLTCGVYVSSSLGSDANGNGTRDKPYSTIARAVQAAHGAPVYACGEAFTGAISLTSSALLYGARDCKAGWEHKAETPTTLTAPPGVIPLRIAADIDVSVLDFVIRAADAEAPGGSSIAVVANNGATVLLERCAIESGAGAPAEDATPEDGAAQSGETGQDGGEACSAAKVPGGAAPSAACGDVAGGAGADGDSDKQAASGLPDTQMNGGDSETEVALCTAGGAGADGADGTDGAGTTTSLGALDATAGFTAPADGAPGKTGSPGNGGGGGGASRGGAGATMCADATKAGGASGGSGGSGGCGGAGGRGGASGGASIGIASLGAQLAFKDTTIKTAAGGKGGDGAAGQAGGEGGKGGEGGLTTATDLHVACGGGSGGAGGKGGSGGGGRGGHSIGIAHTGAAPEATGVTITVGAAGAGGTGTGPMTKAGPGVAGQVQAF
jgi:hypothetical protein